MTQIPFRFLPLETGHWQLVTRGAAAFGHWDFGIGHSLQPADCKLQTGPLDLASVSPYPAPHMNVTIRRAVPADYEAICELAEIMDAPQRGALPDRFRKPEGPVRLRNRTEALMRDRDTFLAVAEIDGRVVGVVNAGLEQMPDYPQKQPLTSVLVRGISVRADCRRQKVGTTLINAAIAWARSRGAVEAQANVYDFNQPAAAFFASLGLAPLSHRLVRRLHP
jgi:GNAT superfamily N-acetyltransferase